MTTHDTSKTPAKKEDKAKAKSSAPKATKAPAKKATAPKAAAKPAAKKEAAPKAAKSGATVTIRQIRSGAGRLPQQNATLKGLGLGKINRTRTLEDTPAVRGMITKVLHLVEIVDAA